MAYREVWINDGENGRWETIYVPDAPVAKTAPAIEAPKVTAPFVLGGGNFPGVEERIVDMGEGTRSEFFIKGTDIRVDNPTFSERWDLAGPMTESSVAPMVQDDYVIYDDKAGGEFIYSPTGQFKGFVEGKRASGLGGFLKEVATETAPIWSAALTAGGLGSTLGASIAPAAQAATQTAIGNAILQGALAEATGGDFVKGALTSAAGSLAGGYVAPAISEAAGSQAIGQALTSGALAKAQGGDFLQGAIQGAIQGATKDAQLNLADKYINAVEPGIGYNPATSPTELDVIQAFPELAPVGNLTQGVTDILNYAANAPSVQLAAGPNYVGEFTGMQYDPNQGAYRLEIGGTGDQQSTAPSAITVPTQEQAQLDIADLINQLEPYLAQNLTMEDIQSIIGQQNFATPDDIQTAINSIDIPQGLSQADVQNIVSNALVNNPGLTASDVQSIVDSAVSQIPSGLTAQDVTNILGQQNFATPEDIQAAISGIQFPENMTPQDVQDIVLEAFQSNPGITATDVQDIVQGALNNLPQGLSSDDVRNIVTDVVANIPSAPTEQDIIKIISGQNFATPEDIQAAINSINIPQGLSQSDVESIVSNALANNPNLTAEDVSKSIADYMQANPGLSANDVSTAISNAVSGLATTKDIEDAIAGIEFPAGLTKEDVAAQIKDAFAANPNLTTTDIQDIVNTAISNIPAGLTAEDVTGILGQQNFATPEDIQAAISGIQFPEGMTPEDVQGIVSEAFKNNPGITSTEVQDIVQGALNNLPPGLSSADVSTIVNDAISNLPSAPTQQDIIDIIGGQGLATSQDLGNLAEQLGLTQEELFNQLGNVEQGFGEQLGNVQTSLESKLGEQGKQLFDALQQQGVDYTTALNEAINAQNNNFADYQSATESALGGLGEQIGNVQANLESQLGEQGKQLLDALQQQGMDYSTALDEAIKAQNTNFAEYQSATESALGGLAEQLGLTQQQLIDQLNQAQESFGTQFSELQGQFSNLDTANAERYADLIKTIGLLGTGLGTIQSMFQSAQEAAAPKQFEIVAPPSEWKSPTYNLPQAGQVPFTPSAPIDFGSPQLLQGTQFANPQVQATQMPYDLSNVINTLNFQSVPFVQQQVSQPSFAGFANQPTSTVGVNDIIGGLNGQPVSIADIISNIQGQYGQKVAS